MAPKKHSGKKRSRRMKGGMTTGQWGIKVFGGSDSQQAVGAGSNVIRMNDPNSVVAAPQMKGGMEMPDFAGIFGTDSSVPIVKQAPADEAAAAAKKAADEAAAAAAAAAKKAADEAAAAAAVPAMGGKRKSATKRRKSHKKKGKSSKKRAHKRH